MIVKVNFRLRSNFVFVVLTRFYIKNIWRFIYNFSISDIYNNFYYYIVVIVVEVKATFL